MQIVATANLKGLLSFITNAERLAGPAVKTELARAVVDAGRKMKTKVQRAVTKQMALKQGSYGSYVVANTRGVPNKAGLSFDIFGVKGGAKIEMYRGLRSSGKTYPEGGIESGVWNRQRTFKRSFEAKGGFYALQPAEAGATTTAPRVLWTPGAHPGQPRDQDGRFKSTGIVYGKVRRLFGPSMRNEIGEGATLAGFMAEGPILLEQAVMKRIARLVGQ